VVGENIGVADLIEYHDDAIRTKTNFQLPTHKTESRRSVPTALLQSTKEAWKKAGASEGAEYASPGSRRKGEWRA
jgi:hypothetical protein